MFSKRCEYGLRALTIIGEVGKENRKIGIKEICKLAKTPESFTAKILQTLVKRGIVSSLKGPNGGFYFSKNINDVSIYDIVYAIDGDEIFKKCGLGLSECSTEQPCPFHDKFMMVRTELFETCKRNSLNDLLKGFNIQSYNR